MSRNLAFGLVLIALASAVTLGWLANRKVQYFPPEYRTTAVRCEWGRELLINDFEEEWFGGPLREANEPSFYLQSRQQRPGGPRSYRFAWHPSWHPEVIVRVDVGAGGQARLTATQLSGPNPPGYLRGSRRLERTLSRSELAEFERLLRRTSILQQPSEICDGGCDGSRWIVEAVDQDGYHFINRWTPQSGPMHETGLAMLALTGWRFQDIY